MSGDDADGVAMHLITIVARSSAVVNGADTMGEDLAAWGKVCLLDTIGRVTGKRVRTAVGFVEEEHNLLVAATAEDADWALNLRADHRVTATIGDQQQNYEATELLDDDRNHAVTALILKYGTPAERLGRGPAFRLTPAGFATHD